MTGERGKGTSALHLDEETFRRACRRFVQHSHALSDGWSWEEVKGSDEGYMRKTVLVPGRTAPRSARNGASEPADDLDTLGQREGQDLEDDDEEQAGDDEEHAASETSSPTRYEYHVLYSCSYQAPVLYFRASTLDGRPLSLEDIWDNVHPNYRQRLLQGPWDTITQQAILGFTGFLDSWVHWAPAGQNHCGGGLAKRTPFTTCAGHRSERTTPRHVTYFGHGRAACGRLLVHPARCSQMA
ncbi:ubiquitin-like-conjugating enzyme ATG10 isoform X1 [Anguilla rostrata]|uniref:ubiquitin-like-conjugating enzyme ATG10 isoform X1 n=1 Tax=Anguilla rostrata TaxID=7938 RepID=UPI0030CF77D4